MGAVNTTYTFEATDTITSAKMNNIIDQTTVTSDAIFGTTLEVASGKLKVRSQGITSNELAANAVTTTTITDLNVTTGKVADLAVTTGKLADLGVTTGKLADAAVTPAKLSQPLTLATVQNSTSGTSIDFTSIPSWVKKITVIVSGISINGTSPIIVQLGDSGGFETSGYTGGGFEIKGTPAGVNSTTGILLAPAPIATNIMHGILTLVNLTSNTWVSTWVGNLSEAEQGLISCDTKSLTGTLDSIRLTTAGGVNTFDAGQVNIMYE